MTQFFEKERNKERKIRKEKKREKRGKKERKKSDKYKSNVYFPVNLSIERSYINKLHKHIFLPH